MAVASTVVQKFPFTGTLVDDDVAVSPIIDI